MPEGKSSQEDDTTYLLARAAIGDLVHGYANAVAVGDTEFCASLFAVDATFEVRVSDVSSGKGSTRQSFIEGQTAIHEFLLKSVQVSNKIILPLIHNLVIDVRGASATSRCLMMGVDPLGSPTFTGFYQDSYRSDAGWNFLSRQFTMSGWHK